MGANDVVAVSTDDQLTRCLLQEQRSVAVCSSAIEKWGIAFIGGAAAVGSAWFFFDYARQRMFKK
jgi:hypothetical protein